MNEKEKLNYLKENYEEIEIPDELEFLVKKSLKQNDNKYSLKIKKWKISGIAAVIVFGIFVTSINISPTLAENLIDIPIIGSFVKVFMFTNYTVKEDGFDANIKVPNISGLEDKELENKLNEQFIEEGQSLYNDFIKQMEEIKSQGGEGHIGLDTTYKIKTDNDKFFSIVLIKTEIMASASTEYTAYTIDKKNKAVVTLKSLFKDNSYIEIISENIKNQMREQMKQDENIMYFIDEEDIPENNFKAIKENQNFYINDNGNIVILFDEYEVAPGYMGSLEFIIPTEEIKSIILDRGLINLDS